MITMVIRFMLWGVRIMARFGALCWRFAIGQPLSGQARTNATWIRRGTATLGDDAGDPFPWSYLPGWEKMLIRWGVVWATVVYFVGLAVAPVLTNVAAVVLIGAFVTWRVRRYRQLKPLREHQRELVEPLDRTLREVVPDMVRGAVDVPLTYDENHETPVVITLPDTFAGAADSRADQVRNIVAAKLAFSSKVNYRFESRGLVSRLIMSVVPQPPRKVTYDDIADAFEAAPDTAPVIGQTAGRRIVSADFRADSPHVLVSAGSGGGKSVLNRTIIAQHLHRGGLAVMLDVKFLSHMWMRGLPGVIYCRTPEMIHNVLISLAEEGKRRFTEAANTLDEQLMGGQDDEVPDDDDIDVGPRVLIVAEEMNATITRLTDYWEQTRPKGSKKRSPAVEALNDILFMGRQARMHVLAVGQYMTANTIGGAAARENFATRCLTRATQNAWNMLAPQIKPIPPASNIQGRWHIVTGDKVTETQVAFLSPREARKYARAGIEYDGSVPLSPTTGEATSREDARDTSPSPANEAAPEPAPPGRPALRLVADNTDTQTESETDNEKPQRRYLTLPEAGREQFLMDPRTDKPASYAQIKKAVQRAREAGDGPEFVKRGKNVLYERESLRIWWENRPIMRMTGTTGKSEGGE